MLRLIPAFLALLALVLLTNHDTLGLSAAEELSFRYRFNIAAWTVRHLPSKWLSEAQELLFPLHLGREAPQETVERYFQVEGAIRSLETEAERAFASGGQPEEDLQERLRRLRGERDSLRPPVEAILEAELAAALREEGIFLYLPGLVLPPVDFALARLPHVLTTSPRDRIERLGDVTLTSNIPIGEWESLEARILESEDLSALVEGIAGLAVYPSAMNPGDLRRALEVASHEWLHQYLFFYALGQSYGRTGDMASLNETVADLVGGEIGDRAYTRLTREELPPRRPPDEPAPEALEEGFSFRREMHETRLRVDELLADGQVPEAEAYMEERRQLFVENGYAIRKLNQAYFAFHGTYGDSPASISPLDGQLRELRTQSASLVDFMNQVRGISRYEQLQELLEEKGIGTG